jgi:RLL motif-containing protein 1
VCLTPHADIHARARAAIRSAKHMGFERRLLALGFPEARAFDGSSAKQASSLAAWLEDRVIRRLPIEARGQLRTGDLSALRAYLVELEAPEAVLADLQGRRFPAVSAWLTLTALQCAVEDLGEGVDLERPQHSVESLAAAHGVASDPGDRAGTLQAALQAARRGSVAGEGGATEEGRGAEGDAAYSGAKEDFPLGFETGDAALDEAARGLRMQYVAELRVLQSHFNAVVACAQEFTANPKTDSQLGRVGR